MQVYEVVHADEVASNVSRAIGEVRGAHLWPVPRPLCRACRLSFAHTSSAAAV